MQHHTNKGSFIFSTVQFNMVQFIYDVQHYEYKFIMRAEKKIGVIWISVRPAVISGVELRECVLGLFYLAYW